MMRAVRPGDMGGVAMPDEAPALGVREDTSCGDGSGDLPLFRDGVVLPGAPEGSPAGGGAYRAEPGGHFTIDPGRIAQPLTSRSQDGMRSRLQVEQTFLEREG